MRISSTSRSVEGGRMCLRLGKIGFKSIAVFGVLVCIMVMAMPAGARKPGNKGGGKDKPTQWRVFMANADEKGILTDCNENEAVGYVRARIPPEAASGPRHTYLRVDGPDANFHLVNTGVEWSREFPVLSGVFDGCFGVTPSSNGDFSIHFNRESGSTKVLFTWNFEFYIYTDKVNNDLEYFTMYSGPLPFPKWDDQEGVSGRVSGMFHFLWYPNYTDDPENYGTPKYIGDAYLEFDLAVVPDL